MNYEVTIIPDDPQDLLIDDTEEIIVSKSVVKAIIQAHQEQVKAGLKAVNKRVRD
ncbi:hypothetical protein [Aeromonas hydrophila]|uniref:hypothetical protein n=1 Tax=Aeromonas hydrophila TaxID=644 RepID=UPI003D1A53DC